jgi:hypothetical protein
MIHTINGYTLIENLKIGDFIKDYHDNKLEIKSIVKRSCNTNDLYVLRKNNLEKGYPTKDLYISGNHFIKYNSKIYFVNYLKSVLKQI